MSTWELFFRWPTGAIWSNLLASLIWEVPTISLALWAFYRRHQIAKRTHQIIADLFEHHTGEAHPMSPTPNGRPKK